MMARPWKDPQFLLAILVSLVALTYQGKKTFIHVYEVSAVEPYVQESLKHVTDEYNRKSEDMYNFRIIRILKIVKQVTDHLEFHISVEMGRTTCLKPGKNSCDIQDGVLYKQVQCYFSVYAIPWNEKYKTLKNNCSQS